MAKGKSKEKAKPKKKKEKSSSGGGMQQMLLDHGEKIGLGVVGVIFLVCAAFGFIGKQSTDKTIDQLTSAIASKESAMAAITYEAGADPSWVELAKSEAKAPHPPYQLDPWVRPLFPLQGVRTEPDYYGPEQLRVIAGRAPFNVLGAGAAAADAGNVGPGGDLAGGTVDENTASKGEYYVVGTFLIPVGKQQAEYANKFGGTMKMPGDERPEQDMPEYFRYVVERAQVSPGMTDDQLQWIALNPADNAAVTDDNRFPALAAKKAEWAAVRPDVVPAAFTEPVLTYGDLPKMDELVPWLPPRLPPGQAAEWTWTEVGHSVIADMVRAFNEQAAAAAAADADTAVAVDPEEAMRTFAAKQGYRMGRFWDFTVEPGAQYRYRVTLVLRNPNRGYTKQYLKSEDLAQGAYRPANPLDASDANRPVSEASYIVAVPGRSEIAVGSVVSEDEKSNKSGEDLATVVATVWENTAEAIADFEQEANAVRIPRLKAPMLAELAVLKEVWANVDYVEASMEFRVARGQFLRLTSPTQINHPLFNKIETLKNVRFDTGFTLVDMRGGKPLVAADGAAASAAPAMTPPAEYLLLDPDGNLVIRSEIGDRAAYKRRLAAVTQAAVEDAGGSTLDQLR